MKIHISMMFLMAICLFGAAQNINACDCGMPPVKKKLDRSTLVFAGRVTGLEYRGDVPNLIAAESAQRDGSTYETLTVNFEVDQWWKGAPTKNIFLVQIAARFSKGYSLRNSCDFHFETGKTYLVYASGKNNYYAADFCSGTTGFAGAKDDLQFLGESQPPLVCPKIVIDDKNNQHNESWEYSAHFFNAADDRNLSYKWTFYRNGRKAQIKTGQGTKSITVTVGDVDLYLGIAAFVEVGGLPAGCENKVGISAIS